jgi:hypothetical protein
MNHIGVDHQPLKRTENNQVVLTTKTHQTTGHFVLPPNPNQKQKPISAKFVDDLSSHMRQLRTANSVGFKSIYDGNRHNAICGGESVTDRAIYMLLQIRHNPNLLVRLPVTIGNVTHNNLNCFLIRSQSQPELPCYRKKQNPEDPITSTLQILNHLQHNDLNFIAGLPSA